MTVNQTVPVTVNQTVPVTVNQTVPDEEQSTDESGNSPIIGTVYEHILYLVLKNYKWDIFFPFSDSSKIAFIKLSTSTTQTKVASLQRYL